MATRFLIFQHRNGWSIRPWTPVHGENCIEVTAQEVLDRCPHFTDVSEFADMGGEVEGEDDEPPATQAEDELDGGDEQPPAFAVSPTAQALADANNLNLSELAITGTGANGTIVKADVEAILPKESEVAAVLDQL